MVEQKNKSKDLKEDRGEDKMKKCNCEKCDCKDCKCECCK